MECNRGKNGGNVANKMSVWGIGPKLGIFSLPYLVLGIVIRMLYPNSLKMDFLSQKLALILGALILLVGLIFYIASAKTLFAKFKTEKLIQSGPYSLCRNPIYASFIVFFVPALAFFTRSWFILSFSIVLYGIFKVLIKKENNYLEKAFGDEYKQYVAKVNEIIPFPRFWKS
jgi:protein-S-isoprenylcysteine O-methyltransferase Ste14